MDIPSIDYILDEAAKNNMAIWQVVLVALQFAIYFPFFRIVDKQALEAEQAAAAGK